MAWESAAFRVSSPLSSATDWAVEVLVFRDIIGA
jgi:hypothetical protein